MKKVNTPTYIVWGAVALLATLFWFSVSQVLSLNWTISGWGGILALLCLTLALLPLLLSFFTFEKKRGAVSVLLFLLPSLLFLPISLEVGVGLLISFLLIFWAHARSHKESKERVKLQIHRVLKRGLPLAFTALAILIGIFYLGSGTGQLQIPEKVVPRGVFDVMYGTASPLIIPDQKEVDKDLRADVLLYTLEKGGQGTNIVSDLGIEGGNLEELLQNREAIGQVLNQLRQSNLQIPEEELATFREDFSNRSGITLTKNDNLDDLLYKLLNKRLVGSAPEIQTFLPIILAIGLMIFLRVIGIFWYWPTLGAFSLFLWLLQKLNFVKIEKEKRLKEHIIYA